MARYLILLALLVGCAPAKPAGCPLRPQRQEVEEALASVRTSIASLEKMEAAAGGVLEMFPGVKFRYERALQEAREKAGQLEQQLQQADDGG